MDDDSYATLLKNFVNIWSLWVAQINAKKVLGLDHLVHAKKWSVSSKKALNTIHCITQCGVSTMLHPCLSRQVRKNYHQLQDRRLLHNVYSDTLFATTMCRRGNRCAQIFAITFDWSCSFPMKFKSEAREALSLLFSEMGCHLQQYVMMPKK